MTSQTLFCLFFLITILSSTAFSSTDTNFIRRSCAPTLHPKICFHSLSPYAQIVHQNHNRLVRAAITVSLYRSRLEATNFSSLSKEAELQPVLHDCVSVFETAVELQRRSLEQMARLTVRSFRFEMSNVQTWMSAALTNEETCRDGFDGAAASATKTQVLDRVSRVEAVTSNALSLVNAYAANSSVGLI